MTTVYPLPPRQHKTRRLHHGQLPLNQRHPRYPPLNYSLQKYAATRLSQLFCCPPPRLPGAASLCIEGIALLLYLLHNILGMLVALSRLAQPFPRLETAAIREVWAPHFAHAGEMLPDVWHVGVGRDLAQYGDPNHLDRGDRGNLGALPTIRHRHNLRRNSYRAHDDGAP
jgi:hypothetical protein